MSWTAALLLIASAFMHASWNFISKRRSPSLAFFFVAAVSAALVVSPLLIVYRHALPLVSPPVWGLIGCTGMAQAVYFSGLAGAYRRGDMSLAYPLARALPVLAVAAISLLLGRGNQIGRLSLAGMALISVGCIVLPLPHFRRLRLRDYADGVYVMAVVAAAGTTAYTLLDDAILRQLGALPDFPLIGVQVTLLFIALQALCTCVMLGVTTLASTREREALGGLLRKRPFLLSSLLTGVVIMATYGLVLAAMAHVRDVSYVAAFRQLSIPIGAVLGLTLQNEARYRPKLVGIVVISVGLILVGIG